MSTQNIGFYEDLTKIIFQLSSNTHLISSSDGSIMNFSATSEKLLQSFHNMVSQFWTFEWEFYISKSSTVNLYNLSVHHLLFIVNIFKQDSSEAIWAICNSFQISQ